MKWFREIRKVGVIDWLWFVVYLKRNEFSVKLDMWEYYPDLQSLTKARMRAHNIDMALQDIDDPVNSKWI